jgi:hypothetical protein
MKNQIEDKIESVKIGDKVKQTTRKIKIHFRKNQQFYKGVGLGVAIVLAVRRPIKIAPIFNNTNMVITDLSRRGHPGNLTQCIETDEVFASQSRAADIMGIARPNLVSHLNGKLPHVGGYTFKRLGEAV